jgi:hypothetical protein
MRSSDLCFFDMKWNYYSSHGGGELLQQSWLRKTIAPATVVSLEISHVLSAGLFFWQFPMSWTVLMLRRDGVVLSQFQEVFYSSWRTKCSIHLESPELGSYFCAKCVGFCSYVQLLFVLLVVLTVLMLRRDGVVLSQFLEVFCSSWRTKCSVHLESPELGSYFCAKCFNW